MMDVPESSEHPSRRSFLINGLAASIAVGSASAGLFGGTVAAAPGGSKVIDCHAHLEHRSRSSWEANDRKLIAAADRLGIDVLCCSILTPRRPASTEGFRECNRWVADATRRFPGRVLGYCYVNPGSGKDATEEVRRCVGDLGFIGVKLYNEFKCTDPLVFPVIEAAIELKVPILHHAGHLHYALAEQPRISDGGDLAELATRYPEARLICAHICGGGDWEWTIKALRHAPSVYLDTSGSVTDGGVVDMAVRTLGVDRLLFGCDMSLTAGVGRIRAADLSDADRAKILGGTMEAILKERKP